MPYDYYITPEEYEEAEKNGVDAHNLERRVRLLGWRKQKAISTPIRKGTDRKYWAEIAKQNGIKYQTFMGRINNLGWDEEKAATEPLRKPRIKGIYEPNRKIPEEIIRLAEKNGIKYPTLWSRIRRGVDPIVAATEPTMSHSESGKLGARAFEREHGNLYELMFTRYRSQQRARTKDTV